MRDWDTINMGSHINTYDYPDDESSLYDEFYIEDNLEEEEIEYDN